MSCLLTFGSSFLFWSVFYGSPGSSDEVSKRFDNISPNDAPSTWKLQLDGLRFLAKGAPRSIYTSTTYYSIYDDAVYPWESVWMESWLTAQTSCSSNYSVVVQLSIDSSSQCWTDLNNTLSRISIKRVLAIRQHDKIGFEKSKKKMMRVGEYFWDDM